MTASVGDTHTPVNAHRFGNDAPVWNAIDAYRLPLMMPVLFRPYAMSSIDWFSFVS